MSCKILDSTRGGFTEDLRTQIELVSSGMLQKICLPIFRCHCLYYPAGMLNFDYINTVHALPRIRGNTPNPDGSDLDI